MMRTLRIYSLNHFPKYHTAVLTSHHVVRHMSSTYLPFNWKFVPFNHLSPLIDYLSNHLF